MDVELLMEYLLGVYAPDRLHRTGFLFDWTMVEAVFYKNPVVQLLKHCKKLILARLFGLNWFNNASLSFCISPKVFFLNQWPVFTNRIFPGISDDFVGCDAQSNGRWTKEKKQRQTQSDHAWKLNHKTFEYFLSYPSRWRLHPRKYPPVCINWLLTERYRQ